MTSQTSSRSPVLWYATVLLTTLLTMPWAHAAAADPRPGAAAPPAEPKIMTFNAMQLGYFSKKYQNIQRANFLKNSADLLANDVVVLTEFFYVRNELPPLDSDQADRIRKELASTFPYQTPIVGANTQKQWDWYDDRNDAPYNGGVLILSKWPIIRKVGVEYAPSTLCGDDTYADKGFAYVVIKPPTGPLLHVVGTHTQADDPKCANRGTNLHHGVRQRAQQFKDIDRFLAAPNDWINDRKVNVPKPAASERVVIAGDLNVDRYDTREYSSMLRTLGTDAPHEYFPQNAGEDTRKAYSFDTQRNMITRSRYYDGADTTELLDHVLYRKDHPHPTWYVNAVHHVWSPRYAQHYPSTVTDRAFLYHLERELSDHYAVSNWRRCPDEAARGCTLTRISLTSARYGTSGLTSAGGIKVNDIPIWQEPTPRTFDDLLAEPVARKANYVDQWNPTTFIMLDALVLGPNGTQAYGVRTLDSQWLSGTPGQHTATIEGHGEFGNQTAATLTITYTISTVTSAAPLSP